MNGENRKDILIGSLCAIGCETLFGLSYIFTKQVTDRISPFSLLGWRFLIAALLMGFCAVLGIAKIDLKGKPVKPLLRVAVFCPACYFIGETIGINYTSASESGVFLSCIPVISLLTSSLILRKKPEVRQTVGILITLTGVIATIFAAGVTLNFSPLGYAMLSAAAVSYALYSVYVEKARNYSGAEITFVMLFAGAVLFVALAVAEAVLGGDLYAWLSLPFTDGNFLIAVLYQGIGCSVLAFFMANMAISKIGVNRTASFVGIAAVVSIAAGIFILHEEFLISQAAGAILILLGVYTANRKSSSAKE